VNHFNTGFLVRFRLEAVTVFWDFPCERHATIGGDSHVRTNFISMLRKNIWNKHAWLVGLAVLLPLTVFAEDPLLGLPPLPSDEQLALPKNLGSFFLSERGSADATSQLQLEPVAKPIDSIVQTPWKTPAYSTTTQPGVVLSQTQKLPWGFQAEWRVGVAAPTKATGTVELPDTSLWSVKTGIGDKFFVYLHDKGSGFVRYFGDSLSVYGRVVNGNDKRTVPTSVQLGASRSF
jgi:hypothetical protein